MNRKVEVTRKMLHTVIHSHMVHARFLEAYVHFELMDKTYHIFPVLPIKYLMNEDGDPKMPHKITTGKNLQYHITRVFSPVLYGKLRRMLR